MAVKLDQLIDYMDACIYEDYLMGILITSAAEGKIPSDGFDYGPGKSTLAWDLGYLFLKDWDKVFESAHYFPWELEYFFLHQRRRAIIYIWEDMQLTVGKDKSKDNYVRGLKNRLTTARPQLAIFIGTSPDIGEIAYPFRYFFNFEIKVPYRGKYEVQRLKKWTPFDNPYVTKSSLQYKSEFTFPALPRDVEKRYVKWRADRNRRYDLGEGEVKLRKVQRVLTDKSKALLSHLVKRGSLTRQTIITDLDQQQELRLLLNCGLAEKFGDVIVPTSQAKIVTEAITLP